MNCLLPSMRRLGSSSTLSMDKKAWKGGDRCKYCDYLDLEWHQDATTNRWFLMTRSGKRHLCKPYKERGKWTTV